MNFIAFIFVIGVLVFVHELGHFFVAKLRKVKVERFSLGFGPKLVGFSKGDTEYVVSMIPLGGYVKLAGESPEEELTGADYEFASKPVSTRAQIVAMGPLMNFLLAIFIFFIVFMIGVPYISAKIGTVKDDWPAQQIGLKPGDKIVAINGKEIKSWEKLTKIIHTSAGEELTLEVVRGNKKFKKQVVPREHEDMKVGLIGITPYLEAKIGEVRSDMRRLGIKEGDIILKINGRKVKQWYDLEKVFKKEEIGKHRLALFRDGKVLSVDILAKYDSEIDTWELGFGPYVEIRKYNPVRALGKSVVQTYEFATQVCVVLGKLIRGKISMKVLGGPVLIADLAGRQAKAGMLSLFLLVAVLSINLGVINLLPFPVLDGGHLLFFVIEAVTRKGLSVKTKQILQQAGAICLIALMVLITYNDIVRKGWVDKINGWWKKCIVEKQEK